MDVNNNLTVDGSVTASGKLGGGCRRRAKAMQCSSGAMGRSHPPSRPQI